MTNTPDIFLVIMACLLVIAGLLGSMRKKFPGTILGYLGMILFHYSGYIHLSLHFFVQWGVIIIAIQGLNYFLPQWGKRRFGGTKKGVWGSLIGLLAGMILGKWGLVAGAVAGAAVGEMLAGKKSNEAILKSVGAFAVFIAGTISELIVAGLFFYKVIFTLIYLI